MNFRLKSVLVAGLSAHLFLGVAAAQATAPADGGRQLVNKIAAKVNGEVITLNELNVRVNPQRFVLMSRFPRRGPAFNAQLKQLEDGILNELIDRTIIFTEFKDRINAIPEVQLEEEMKRIVDRVYKGDEALFRRFLEKEGLSRAQFKEQQRKELLVQIVRSQHFGDVPTPTEAELRKEYASWKISNRDRTKDVATYRRIYIRKDRGVSPLSQLSLAEDIAKKLRAGGDFAKLALEHSQDSKAKKGGLWQEVPRVDRSIEFGYILFESEGNEVMGPFEDRRGFNIVQVVDRKLGPAKPYSEVRDQMKMRVISDKKKANFERWMKKMRSRAEIKKMI